MAEFNPSRQFSDAARRLVPSLAVLLAFMFGAVAQAGPTDRQQELDQDQQPLSGWEAVADDSNARTPAALAQTMPRWQPADAAPPETRIGGALWYRVRLPAALGPEPTVLLTHVRYRYAAFVDDRQVAAFGSPDDPNAGHYAGTPPHLVALPGDAGGQLLYLRLPVDLIRTGIDGPTALGREGDHLRWMIGRDAVELVAGFMPLLIGLVALALFLAARRALLLRDFGAFSAGMGVYCVCHTKLVALLFPHPLLLDHLQYAVTYATPCALLAFSRRTLGPFRRNWERAGIGAFAGLSLVTTLLSAIGLVELPTTLPVFQVLVLVSGAALLIEVGSRLRDKDPVARLLATGAAAICIAAIHDVLVERGLLPWRVSLSLWAVLGFIAGLLFLVARRLQRDTERRVVMQRELETAGILQTRFLPERRIEDARFSLSAFTKAASEVGGDWYSYRIFQGRWLQIHLGDVTGHGTRAALLAAFAKGAVDFYYEDCTQRGVGNPPIDVLHTLMNRALFELGKGEATMTVASLAIDLQTWEVDIVNSAHPSPVVYPPGVAPMRPMSERNRTILGMQRDFVSRPACRHALKGDEMIVLVSDGVFELLKEDPTKSQTRAEIDFFKLHIRESPEFACGMTSLLTSMVEEARQEVADDVTMVAVKFFGAAA